jgi:SOS-response transcriptional repressor LexA
VEVIDRVHKTLVKKWTAHGDREEEVRARWNEYVSKYLLTRLHAYELKMAPYAIAHLKVGLKLYESGYRFGSAERARIYLTNALEPASDSKKQMEFEGWMPALAHEAQAVNAVKRKQRFTVVIGNPPYSGHAKNKGPWIQSLMRERLSDGANGYFEVDGAPLGERNPKWVNDDYVQFIRLSQAVIAATGAGLLGIITAHGYLENPTFRGVRQSLMRSFRRITLINLNGNAKRGAATSTEGVDENVFEIQQGVAIALMRLPVLVLPPLVEYQSITGSRQKKYVYLSMPASSGSPVLPVSPFYLFIPQSLGPATEYEAAISLKEVMPYSNTGMITSRDGFVIGFTKAEVASRIADFASRPIAESRRKYDLTDVRERTLEESRRMVREMRDRDGKIQPIEYRPFDKRQVFYHHALVRWPGYDLTKHLLQDGNRAIGTVRRAEIAEGWSHVFCIGGLAQHHTVSNKEVNYFFPLYVYPEELFRVKKESPPEGNFSAGVVKRFSEATGLMWDPSMRGSAGAAFGPKDVFHYVYAQLHSLKYRDRYAENLKLDSPRVFVPSEAVLFRRLAELGGDLVALHLMQSPKLGRLISTYIGPKNPEVGRVSWSDDTVWLDAAAAGKAQPTAVGTFGFRDVPREVWDFHIGGYQVCEKWLKDRKGRRLLKEDLVHYQKIIVALNETIRLMKEIDEVIEKHGGWPEAFHTGVEKAAEPRVIPARPRAVQPTPKERYVTCVPLVPLKVAAGAFGDPQHVKDEGFVWVAVETKHRLRRGMFVAQVVGKSMEPRIPDRSFCLFAAPVEGTRLGKTVLVQLRDTKDLETGERYTVKRYESEKEAADGAWRHRRVTLKPDNPDFAPIILDGDESRELQVIAELIEVLQGEGGAEPVT